MTSLRSCNKKSHPQKSSSNSTKKLQGAIHNPNKTLKNLEKRKRSNSIRKSKKEEKIIPQLPKTILKILTLQKNTKMLTKLPVTTVIKRVIMSENIQNLGQKTSSSFGNFYIGNSQLGSLNYPIVVHILYLLSYPISRSVWGQDPNKLWQ